MSRVSLPVSFPIDRPVKHTHPLAWTVPLLVSLSLPQAPGFAQSSVFAQSTPPPTLRQGEQVQINGRLLNLPWRQWSGGTTIRTGLSEAALTRAIGPAWLNAPSPTEQPVQWFSDPVASPLRLSTHIREQVRYLDLLPLVQFAGWTMQPNGSILQITTPTTKLLALRQGKQSWGDRLVLEFERPTPWQVETQGSDTVITIDATVDANVLPTLKVTPTPQLSALQVESLPNQTRLRLATGMRPRIWSLAKPNRMVIDIRPDPQIDQDIQWAPGIRLRRQIISLGRDRFPMVWLELNPQQPGLTIQPILPNRDRLAGIAPLAQTARQAGAIAAINGGFFNRNNQFPLGAIRSNNQWLSGPILNRGAIAWTKTHESQFARLTLSEFVVLPNKTQLPLTHLNSAYLQAGIARYTTEWGPTYTTLSDNEVVLTVQNNRITAQQSVAAVGTQTIPIPADGYVLVARSQASAAQTLPVGTPVQLDSRLTPANFDRASAIVAAGPLLLQNRQIVLDAKAEQFSDAFNNERASRSAIARLSNGHWAMAAVHTRIGGPGPSLGEMAQLMQQLGAIDALNLDGGSSTSLFLGGQLIDRPPQTAARVHQGIGIFFSPLP